MIRNYIKTAFRTLQKNKVFSLINLIGLTVGICACMLVLTVALDDLSYDRFWKRSADLYRVYMTNKMGDGIYKQGAYTPIGLGTELKERFPEVECFSSVNTFKLQLKSTEAGPDGINTDVVMMDFGAVRMFDFKKVAGQLNHYVVGQQNILLTESLSNRLFKGENPIGKFIYNVPTWEAEPTPYLVTAIIKDLPQNTHLRAEAIILKQPRTERIEKNQGNSIAQVYYLLKPNTKIKSFEAKVNDWYAKHLDIEKGKEVFAFQPIQEIYLYSVFNDSQKVKSSIRSVYIFGVIGIFLLLIACINFINLSTARAIQRLKESGIRKILGADRKQLIGQFLTESLLFFFISAILALFLYTLSLPLLERFIGHGLTRTVFANGFIFITTLFSVLLLSLLTGIYPALLLSGFNPSNSLRGRFVGSSLVSSGLFRKALVVVQFSLAVVTLIALLVVRSQLRFMNQKDLGFDKQHLLYVRPVSFEGKSEAIKTQLKQLSGVVHVGISGWNPENGSNSGSMTFEHPKRPGEQVQVNFIASDLDFAQTLGFQLKKGRLSDRTFGADMYKSSEKEPESDQEPASKRKKNEGEPKGHPVLISESMAKDFGIDKTDIQIPSTNFEAIGIIKDFYYESLHHSLTPLCIDAGSDPDFGGMFIRIVPGQEQQVLSKLNQIWTSVFQDKLLSVDWMDDIIRMHYEKERKQQTLFTFFSSLMLFISSLGVFGLVLHAAEQRVKEIGIRKVLGASVSSIVRLLSKDFVRLVLLAILIASPLAWWAMNKWLEDFAYHTELEWWMFGLAGLGALMVALLTVSYQSIKAALANPTESLRNE